MDAECGSGQVWGVFKMKTVVLKQHSRSALLLGAALGLVLSVSSSAQAMSLKDAIQLVLTTNPEVGVVAKDRRAGDQGLRQARGLDFPQIDAGIDGGPGFPQSATVG